MRVVQILLEWTASYVEVLLYFAFIQTVAEKYFNRKKQALFCFLVSTAIVAGVTLLNMAEISISLPTLLYAVVAYALGACILYQGRIAEFLFASTGFTAYITLIETSALAILGRMGMEDAVAGILSGYGIYRVVFVVSVKVFETVMVFLLCMVFRRVSYRLKVSGGYVTVVTCLLLGGTGGIYLVTQAESLVGLGLNPIQMLLGFSLILVACTAYLFLRIQEARQEKAYIARQNQILEQNYQAAKEAYESNAMLYHDMRNHFAMVQGYLTDGRVFEAQAYIEKINGWLDAYPKECWTGIGALDYILNQKKKTADKQGTGMAIHAEYPKDCRIDPVDLCIILTNLLDNALEACSKQPEGERREITVTIRRINLFLIIRITNSCTAEPDIQNGSLLTTKKDRKLHGWGLRSVKAAVEKYQGVMEFGCCDSVFTADIMLFYQ